MKPNKRSSRLLALALLLVLSLSLSLPALAAGEDDIIYIHTAKDLCAFSDSCAYDAWSRGKTVLLTADISLRGVDFEPIASFSGTFNGGGHTISGLTLTESLSPAGLFLTLERGAFVHALKVEGQVAPGGTKEAVGGIAGRSYGTIEECSFFGVVKGESAVGGIVGRNEASGLVANCTVSGSVSANRYTGGIAGYNLGTLRACINSASVNTANVDPTLSLDDLSIDPASSLTDLVSVGAVESRNATSDTGGIAGRSSGLILSSANAGDVGYGAAAIKDVREPRVGDTITAAMNPADCPLPGYRQVTPMVYCGVYPADGADYPALKDALEKLRMNDASLSFDPETSVALGYGFRCGFLGLLHMDIITERLEREWDLNLVTTAPSVIYRITKTDGTVLMCDNPMALPPIGEIAMMEEPFVHAEIFTPQDSVGTIMDLCQDRRGIFLDMQYEGTRVKLNYDIPLNEIIFDFFDQIKSRSRGYASFDYEFKDYRESQLVKLDILLNGEICDAFSIIVHRDKAYGRGRSICEKLKDVIPRQMFEIPIQAAIGGKVIARETVKAMRKDVLAKCYGGDISRKKKLLEKQKEGKKRMRQFGTVQVPSEAFLAVLKMDSD